MCDTLRNTRSRGRSAVPAIRLRCRSAMRCRRSFFVLIFMASASSYRLPALLRARLSRLLLEHFARVPDPLLLIGIGLAEAPDVRRDLSDLLPVDPGYGDVRLLVDRDVDALRDIEHDRVRIAQRKDDLLALQLRTIPDADDVEVLPEALGHAANGVRDQTARQSVKLAERGVLLERPCLEVITVHLEPDARRQRLPQLALRSLDFHRTGLNVDLDTLRNGDGLLAYT